MSARGTRSLTNERHVSATTLSLSEIFVQNGIVQASMRDIFEIFLKIADVQTLTWDSQSDNPASQKKIAEQIAAALALCRQLSVPVPLADIDGLFAFLQAQYRAISNSTYDLINLRESEGVYFNLATYLADLSQDINSKRTYSVNQDFFYPYRPESLTKHIHIHRPTTAFHTDINHSYQVARTIRRARYEQSFPTEQNYHYTVNRTGEYTLAFGDGTSSAVYDGRISLLKNGVVIQTIQALPDPTNHQNMLMSVDSLGRLFYENAGAHTAAHGSFGGSGSTSDNFIGSLDFLSSSGHIRAITTPNQVTVTTPQSLDSRYYTKTEVDALIATINTYITALNASIGANATYAQGLNTRLVAVEASMPTFKFNGGASQPLLQLQVKSGDFPGTAYYNTHGIVKIATSSPPDANPY